MPKTNPTAPPRPTRREFISTALIGTAALASSAVSGAKPDIVGPADPAQETLLRHAGELSKPRGNSGAF